MTETSKNNSIKEFNKPPVVEAWIEFYFDLSEENTPWTEELATNFIKENFSDFLIKNSEYFARIKVNPHGEPDLSKSEKIFNRIKAFSENSDYCIQAGRNCLIFNQINKGKWLGYDNMRDKSFEVLNKYLDFRGIEKLVDICLHYRDVVKIPSEENKIKLEDFFKIYPKLEEDFGEVSGFSLDLILHESCKNAVTFFTLLNLLSDNVKEFTFQLDWHIKKKPSDKALININESKEWLNQVHSDILKRFTSTFTDKTINIFRSNKT